MASNMIELNLRGAVDELSAMKPALSSSIGRFARDLDAENRRNRGQPRTGQRSTRLPGPPVGRVVANRGASPQKLRTRIPATVVQRQRMLEAQRRGGPPPLEQVVRAGAQRVADAIRSRLLALHNGLGGLERRLQVGTRVLQGSVGSTTRRAPPISNSSEEALLSVLAIVAAAAIGLGAIAHGTRSSRLSFTGRNSNDRVGVLAQAIATAEGYDAPGERDGHSLPHWLNNPGSLKKPALGAENLPTWKDTGLIVFPTEQMGWDALNHQVQLMLTGNSSVYDPSDSILDVAKKYADGDLNWGKNVARKLGISTSCTLGEIAGQQADTSSAVDTQEATHLQLAQNDHQTATQK
jgi:hypothetical protein